MNSTTLQDQRTRDIIGPPSDRRIRDFDAKAKANSGGRHQRAWPMPGPISFIFCAANAAIFAAAIAPNLKGQQAYTDLVGGSLAWSGADKSFDFRLFYAFLAIFSLLLVLVFSLFKRFDGGSSWTKATERALGLSLVPGALWLGGRLTTNSFGNIPIENALLGAGVLVLLFLLSRRRLVIAPASISTIVNASLLALLFAFFGSLGIVTVLSRLVHVLSKGATIELVLVICGLTFLAIVSTILLSSNAEEIQRRLRRVVLSSQILLPLLCAVIIPPAVVERGQQIMSHPSIALMVPMFSTMAAAWAALLHCWIRARHQTSDWLKQSFVPLAILPIAVFVATNHTVYPTFFGDDFHTGEHLLPWQQLHNFGKLPFVGFVPIHPLMDLFAGGANALFFDGTLANYENSRAMLFAVGAGLTFFAVARFAGIELALCLSLAANLWDRLLFTPALFVVFCAASLIANSRRWILCWFCLCPLAVCYNPAIGVAFALASLPVAMFHFWKLFKENRNHLLGVIGVCASVAIAIFLIPQMRQMSLGLAHFLIENGRTVLLAHGIEWQADKAQMPAVNGLLAAPLVWEAFRFSWIIVLLVAAWIFLSRARDWRNVRPQVLAISAMTCLFLFFLAGWTLTRIDPFLPSRPGEVSYLALLYLLPLVLFTTDLWSQIPVPVFFLAIGLFQGATSDFINSGYKPHTLLTATTLLEKPTITLSVPPECIAIDGNSIGLPNLGCIYAPKQILASVLGLKAELDGLLRRGETYLDLTNRQAAYFYFGLPSAVSYGAPWDAANTVLQDRLLTEIKSHPPPVVLLAPSLLHSPDIPPIRLYKLCRFLLKSYLPFSHDGWSFLVAPDRIGDPDFARGNEVNLLRDAFGDENLGWLPSAWGLSWSRLASHFTRVQTLDAPVALITSGTGISLQPSWKRVSGDKADFVKLDFWSNVRPKAKMEIEITWTSEYGVGVARLLAANGTNLVPLGAFPDWLLARNISDINIAPHKPPEDLKYMVRDVELLRLKD